MRPLGFQLTPEQQRLMVENVNLARREAWRMQRRTAMEYSDLESVALIGLAKAASRFDESRGLRFSTLAVPLCRGELLHYCRDHSYLLRFTHRMRETWVKGRRLLDRGATDAAVAKELGISLVEWLDTRTACSGPPLELKEGAAVAAADRLEPEESDRLGRVEHAVERAWFAMGEEWQRNLHQHLRFDHLLRPHVLDTMLAMVEALFHGRDVCFVDYGTQRNPRGVFQPPAVEEWEGGVAFYANIAGEECVPADTCQAPDR